MTTDLVTHSGLDIPEGHKFLSGVDESAPYEVDYTEIWRAPDGSFVLVTASGCSCWDGDFDMQPFTTLDALAESLLGTERTYGNPSAINSQALVEAARAATEAA